MTPCYARPEIVLFHGMWCTGATLEPIASQFRAAGYMVHTPTLPLHKKDLSAEERRRLGKVSMQQYATYLRTYIQNLQLNQPPVLIGHSMGGLLAQMLATQIATRALLLISPAPAAGNNLIHLKSLTAASFILFRNRFWHKSNRPTFWHSPGWLQRSVSSMARSQSEISLKGNAYPIRVVNTKADCLGIHEGALKYQDPRSSARRKRENPPSPAYSRFAPRFVPSVAE